VVVVAVEVMVVVDVVVDVGAVEVVVVVDVVVDVVIGVVVDVVSDAVGEVLADVCGVVVMWACVVVSSTGVSVSSAGGDVLLIVPDELDSSSSFVWSRMFPRSYTQSTARLPLLQSLRIVAPENATSGSQQMRAWPLL